MPLWRGSYRTPACSRPRLPVGGAATCPQRWRVNSAEPRRRSGAAQARRRVALTPSAALPVPPRVPRWPCSSTVGFSQLSKGSAQESSSRWRQRAASARPTNPGIRINPCHRARAPRQRAAQQTWGRRWGGVGWGDEIFGGGRRLRPGVGARRTSRWKASIWSRLSSGRASDASPSIPVALCLCSGRFPRGGIFIQQDKFAFPAAEN